MTDKTNNELAEERTDWAEDRTIQANERTFAGWMRTGVAAMGMGLALHAIFGKSEQTILAKATSTLFLVIAVMIFVQAYLAASSLLNRLNAHSSEPVSTRRMAITSSLFSLGAVLLGVLLWLI